MSRWLPTLGEFVSINSIEEYYQELQTGMIRCGIVEDNKAMLARLMGGVGVKTGRSRVGGPELCV